MPEVREYKFVVRKLFPSSYDECKRHDGWVLYSNDLSMAYDINKPMLEGVEDIEDQVQEMLLHAFDYMNTVDQPILMFNKILNGRTVGLTKFFCAGFEFNNLYEAMRFRGD